MSPGVHASARDLERWLGPTDGEGPFGHAAVVAADEAERYPEAALAALGAWGLHRFYVPEAHGGRLQRFDDLAALLRVVARRDLTTALVHAKTGLGVLPVLVGAGDTPVARRAYQRVAAEDRVSLAATERAHGSDLLATETSARRDGDRWRLSGEKWLISNASRAAAWTVLARTDERGGPRGFGLFFVERDALPPTTFEATARIRTLGIRGADIGGLVFRDAPVDDRATIGAPDAGLGILLKSFQLSRAVLAAVCLGPIEAALASAVGFASNRVLYRRALLSSPFAEGPLAESFAELLVAEAAAFAATRALHEVPGEMNTWSSVVKVVAPMLTESVVQRLGAVLGARSYLRDEHDAGLFQKLLRDVPLLALFDGSTSVNLGAIHAELPRLLGGHDPRLTTTASDRALFEAEAALPPFDPSRLTLTNDGRDSVVGSVDARLEAFDEDLAGVDPVVRDVLRAASARVRAERTELALAVAASGYARSPHAYELARRYALIHTAVVTMETWRHAKGRRGGAYAGGAWLALGVHLLLRRMPRSPDVLPLPIFRTVVAHLAEHVTAGPEPIAPLPRCSPISEARPSSP